MPALAVPGALRARTAGDSAIIPRSNILRRRARIVVVETRDAAPREYYRAGMLLRLYVWGPAEGLRGAEEAPLGGVGRGRASPPSALAPCSSSASAQGR